MVYILIVVGDVINITQIAFFSPESCKRQCNKQEVISELTYK